MTESTHTTYVGAASSERITALAVAVAPAVSGALAPALTPEALFLLGGATMAWGTAAGAAYTGSIPKATLHQIPGGDLLGAHARPMLVSSLASGMALAAGAFGGVAATDALMAGFLDPMSVPGILSLSWWGMTGVALARLRRVLWPRKVKGSAAQAAQGADTGDVAVAVAKVWERYISGEGGTHPGQRLDSIRVTAEEWTADIQAPAGKSVTVTAEAVSSAFQASPSSVHLEEGDHTGHARVTVRIKPRAPFGDLGLAEKWRHFVARKGGPVPGSHLEQVQRDPHSGGVVAQVVANENASALPKVVDRVELAGALRTTPVLVSYETTGNPRLAKVRLMEENPLKSGKPLTGPELLRPSKNGFFAIGTAVSGRPVRVCLLHPQKGAMHLVVTGITGSGKSGVIQLVATGAYLQGSVILYADPKGSSNPAITKMAAYAGLGDEGAMRTLRVVDALLRHRRELTGELLQKNFNPRSMPHVVFILDEASMLLGEGAEYRKEAQPIVDRVAKLGRSLGISLVLGNQILQLAELGGGAGVRDNVIGGGGVIMLRADESQKNLVTLPPGMRGCDPGDIPATWDDDDATTLVYDETTEIADPHITYGLGYYMAPGGSAEMARSFLLEDATPYLGYGKVVEPWDWPDWVNRDAIAEGPAKGEESNALDSFAPKQRGSSGNREKVLHFLETRDPLADPIPAREVIDALGLPESSVLNSLNGLSREGKIARFKKDGRNRYAGLDYAGDWEPERD